MSHSPKELPRWEKLNESVLTTTRIFDVRSVRFRHPVRQKERDFFVVQAPDWVNVIAVTPDHHLVLVNQYRYGIAELSLEVPGGVIDAGEDPVQAGLRELQEETGFVAASGRLLGSVHPNPAFMNNRCHLVLAEGVQREAEQAWDEDEEMEVLTAPVDEVYAWAQRGLITHSLVLNALLLFTPRWAELKGRVK